MAKKSSSIYGSTEGGSGKTGTLSGSAYDYSESYGGKPDVTDPSSSSAAAISGTTSNLGNLYNLSSSVQTAQAQQANETQDILTPGYSRNMAKWASDINDMLSGKVSGDTKYQLLQGAAERGISTGTQGSQANNSSYLRALGLTSIGLQQTGASQLASMFATSPKIQGFDMSQYYTTASDQQAAQQYANTVASAAVPASAASASQGAAQSGVQAGLSAAGTTPATSGGGSSIASLLSSILGSGVGGGGGTTTGNTLGGGIQSALNSILGTGDNYTVTGNTVGGGGSEEEITPYAEEQGLQNYYDDTGAFDYSGVA